MLTIIFFVVFLEYLNKKRRRQLFKVNRIESRYVCRASAILFVDGVILLVFAEVIALLQRFCKIHINHPAMSVKIAFFTICYKYRLVSILFNSKTGRKICKNHEKNIFFTLSVGSCYLRKYG